MTGQVTNDHVILVIALGGSFGVGMILGLICFVIETWFDRKARFREAGKRITGRRHK